MSSQAIMDNYLVTETPAGHMPIFTSAPEGGNNLPVVIVLQEAFGVNSHIKNICRRLAREGYFALAPELYHREGDHLTFEYSDKDGFLTMLAKLTNESLMDDVYVSVLFLETLPHVDRKNIFTMGFCMGGFTSLLAATKFNLRGAVSFYGAGVVHEREGIGYRPFLSKLTESKCPLLLFYGEEDVSIPESDRHAIRSVLDDAHIPHEMIVFGESDHGFFCDERRSYHQEAAEEAWKKSLEWMGSLQGPL